MPVLLQVQLSAARAEELGAEQAISESVVKLQAIQNMAKSFEMVCVSAYGWLVVRMNQSAFRCRMYLLVLMSMHYYYQASRWH